MAVQSDSTHVMERTPPRLQIVDLVMVVSFDSFG